MSVFLYMLFHNPVSLLMCEISLYNIIYRMSHKSDSIVKNDENRLYSQNWLCPPLWFDSFLCWVFHSQFQLKSCIYVYWLTLAFTFHPVVPYLRYSLCNWPVAIHYILFRFYRRARSAAAVNWVLVKVNRYSGLKVAKRKENLGTANWPSCWLLLVTLLGLEMSGASHT